MIEARGLTKRYGDRTAVDDLSFTVRPGTVTGFLGPNGAGKSTTMRMILGLDAPSGGAVTVNGRSYKSHAAPLREVGALLEAKAAHPGRSAYHHLLALAVTNGISRTRVEQVVDLTGLRSVARRRAGGFSLGMGQRLGIAAALLGDPHTLVLDEPVNGLDPEGVLWIRNLLRGIAAQGRTVLVSSHLMSEMAVTADHLIVIGRGRLIADCPMAEFTERASGGAVRVRTPRAGELRDLLIGERVSVTAVERDLIEVSGVGSAEIGRVACEHRLPLVELTPVRASLEDAFMELTGDAVEFRATIGPADHDRSAA